MAGKLYRWLVRNDEKRYYYSMRGKSSSTIRKRLLPAKETLIGREDKLSKQYREILERC